MGRPTKHEQRYRNVGRPTKFTPETLKQFEEAAAIDCSVEEMCFYAGVSQRSYYTYIDNNPEFLQRIEALRNTPVLKARRTVVSGLDNNPNFSFQYLKAKRPNEFAEKIKIQHDDEIDEEDGDLIEEYEGKAKERLQKRIAERSKAQEKKSDENKA